MLKLYAVISMILLPHLSSKAAGATALKPFFATVKSSDYIIKSGGSQEIAEQWRNSTAIYRTHQVKCPSENAGILELVQKNDDGLSMRLRWQNKNDNLRHIIEVAVRGGWEYTEVYSESDLSTDLKVSKMKRARKVYDLMMRQLCDTNPTNADDWKKMIANNRKRYFEN